VLDPIQATVSARSFRDGLAALAPPAPFLAPLGHEISPDAPAGLVAGLTAPVALPVQRRVAGDLDLVTPPAPRPPRPVTAWPGSPTEMGSPTDAAEPPVPARPVTAQNVAPAPPRPVLTSAPPVTAIDRTLRPVTGPSTAPPAPGPPLPLPPTGPPATVQRATAAPAGRAHPDPVRRPAPATGEGAQPALPARETAPVLLNDPVTPMTHGGAPPPETLEIGAAVGPVSSSGATADDGPALAAPLPPTVPAPRASLPTVQRASVTRSGPEPAVAPMVSRRAGLGAPLAERPSAAASPGPVDSSAPLDLALPSPPAAPMPATGPSPVAPVLGELSAGTPLRELATEVPAPSVERRVDVPLVVAQRLASEPLTGTGPGPGSGAGRRRVAGLLAEQAPSPFLPAVQRFPTPDSAPAVPVDRTVTSPVAPGDGALPPLAPPPPGVVPLARIDPTAFSDGGPSAPGPFRSRPAEGAVSVQRLAAPVTAPPTAAPVATGSEPPNLAPVQRFVSPQRAIRPAPAAFAAPTVTVQREADSGGPVLPTGTSDLPASAPAPPDPSGEASAAVAGASGAVSTGDLDALAGRLYDKIRYRLKAELRLDRERAGMITDRR
jgi:hypothetical protein